MSRLDFERVSLPPLGDLSLSLDTGVHVVLGHEQDGSARLIALAAGAESPQRGAVLFDGRAPERTPELRQSLASLLAEEPSLGRGSLGDLLDAVAALRGAGPSNGLSRLGYEPVRSRELATLDAGERRTLALALALSHPGARLVVLHEPFEAARGLELERVLERLQELATSAVLLIATSSSADARRLGGTLYLLERGVITRSPAHAWPAELTPGSRPELAIDCDAPRVLLAELAREAVLSAFQHDAEQAPRRLLVRGADVEALALAVAGAALRAGVTIEALRLVNQDLELVQGASAGLARAAYEAAYSTGQSAWRERSQRSNPPPPPPPLPSPGGQGRRCSPA
jgi:ABC-type taurine transport system ATPase subunit